MKTEPADLDREAARLFVPAPGVHVWIDHSLPHEDTWGDGVWFRVAHVEQVADFGAIDTDDPATVGVMLAQVCEADSGPMGCIRPHRDNPWSSEPPEFAYSQSDGMARHFGVTPGAALVAAMRALKGKP